jgi:hypothetical protein
MGKSFIALDSVAAIQELRDFQLGTRSVCELYTLMAANRNRTYCEGRLFRQQIFVLTFSLSFLWLFLPILHFC